MPASIKADGASLKQTLQEMLPLAFNALRFCLGVQRTGPAGPVIYQNITPVIATVISYLLLGEMPTAGSKNRNSNLR